MARNIRLDHGGVAEMLRSSQVAEAVSAVAEDVAASTRSAPEVTRNAVPVEVATYTTDRAAAAVTIAHPAGLPIEAKYGTLAKAAGGAGLEVRSRGA